MAIRHPTNSTSLSSLVASWAAPLGNSRFRPALPTHHRFRDLTGQRFGGWLVLYYVGKSGIKPMWQCRCECGAERVIRGSALVGGRSNSCGCRVPEAVSNRARTHGMKNHAEYAVWRGMKARCHNPQCPQYLNYGARGIRVCDEWRESFEAFFAHVGHRPTPAHSLDRIDNEGHYEPGNVRWATMQEQLNNTRQNRCLTCRGQTRTLAEWVRLTGIHRETIKRRLTRGWSVEDALTLPLKWGRNKRRK